jgi:hypothetical protein
VAERLAAEEFEAFHQRQPAQATVDSFPPNDDIDGDLQLALALNREFRQEEEERSYRQVQVYPSIILM